MYSPAKLPAPTGLPAALPLQPPHATPISARLSMLREGDRVVYFVHTDPVCSHTADHKLERNLCLARFALFGLATQSELARAHGISQSTVSRAVQRLQVQGELGFAPAPKPRRPDGIVDPAQLAQAARMLRSGLSLYRVAQQLGVSQSTLWRYTQQGLLPASQCLPRRRAGAPAERVTVTLRERARSPAARRPVRRRRRPPARKTATGVTPPPRPSAGAAC